MLSLFFSISSQASWQGWSSVEGYVLEEEGDGSRFYVNMKVDGNPESDNCENGSSGWKRVYGNTEKGRYIISAVLSAHAAKQKMQLNLSGCDDWGRNVVSGIMVHD